MQEFTISIKSWRFGDGEVGTTVDPADERWVIVEYPLAGGPDEKHFHAVPLSGVAFRMEMLGLTDPNDVMDITLKEMNTPEEATQSIYPEAVETYYVASTNIAKALAEEVQTPSVMSSVRPPDIGPDDFLSNVRELLRGGPSSVMTLRADPESPLTKAVSALEKSRASSVQKIRTSQKPVMVEKTRAMDDLRQTISSLSDTILTMADAHAHKAMENGAYHYARNLHRRAKDS